MARPGKAIFDVTMMAGWAFAAVLTGLVALTMVDTTGEPAKDSSVVAALGNDNARLVTGSLPDNQTISPESPKNELVSDQNRSYNPFDKRTQQQLDEFRQVLAELKALKREVSAFHVSTKSLRNENNLLKQRLAKVELGQTTEDSHVRVVALPKRDDARSVFINAKNSSEKMIDLEATGSIAPVAPIPPTGQSFDPFRQKTQPLVKTTVEPLNMDLTVEGASGEMVLPKGKPAEAVSAKDAVVVRPDSEIIKTPVYSVPTSQTSFAIDLGEFLSLTDLSSAWKELSVFQRPVVGDLRPLSRVSQSKDNQLVLNLILGPIQNAAEAASLCAKLKFNGYACHVSVFQGQALASR
ncbi:SPOR domain-containing protein [Cohaesibacter celericrescens]|uniref:SPOR domain-containing protein n=1 Tax=Cohaesibacter celericrescens TaxID=2067669 RepID=A0A2N5XSZ8_9HYPH|nr:SPOR domain-containing protein [Cohaesibacter celericrescens]PLW77641.1 hypothetical protein C0081_10095 [Cohaesibacter celericrescens]